MSKHTPGPWIIGFGDTRQMGHVFAVGLDTKPNWTPVCLISPAADTNSTDYANAYLIAAAPELLEAAKAIVSRWDSPLWKDQPHTGVFIDRLRAAIAKAKGQQP